MRKILFLFTLTFIFSNIALADVRLPDTPTPKNTKSVDAYLTIRIDKTAKDAKLIVPKSQLKQLRAELEQLDNGEDTTVSAITPNFSRTQTIISGMFLSLAFLFGGVWFTRSRKSSSKIGKATITGAVLFLGLSVATIAFANVGPPPEVRNITSNIFSQPVKNFRYASGKIKVEVSNTETKNIQLIVPEVADGKSSNEE